MEDQELLELKEILPKDLPILANIFDSSTYECLWMHNQLVDWDGQEAEGGGVGLCGVVYILNKML